MTKDEMTGLQRILTAAKHEEPDRVPALPLVVNAAALVTGITIKEYATDGEKRAEAQIAAQEEYINDGVISGVDLCHEAEVMGSGVRFPENNIPSIEDHLLKHYTDIDKIKIPDPQTDGRMPELLKCNSILKEKVGDEVVVVGVGVGPFTIAGQLRGLERLLSDLKENPDWVKRLLEITTRVGMEYGVAQLEAGAHVIVTLEPMAESRILSVEKWDEWVQPYLERYAKAFKEAGGVWLPYMAGLSSPVLERFVQAGAPALGVDWHNDLADTTRRVGDDLLLFGNVKPLTLLYGTREEVVEETTECIKQAAHGGGYVVSVGCEVPPFAPPENIRAMAETAREFTYPLEF